MQTVKTLEMWNGVERYQGTGPLLPEDQLTKQVPASRADMTMTPIDVSHCPDDNFEMLDSICVIPRRMERE